MNVFAAIFPENQKAAGSPAACHTAKSRYRCYLRCCPAEQSDRTSRVRATVADQTNVPRNALDLHFGAYAITMRKTAVH